MRTNNQHFLVISALGGDRVDALEAFTKVSKQCGCNILESKLTIMGRECGLFLYLAGTWNTIAKLEAALPPLAQQLGFIIHSKRTLPPETPPALPYQVQISAQDKVGILNDLATFFTQERITIAHMECESFGTKNNTQMTNIHFLINIPAELHIASIRERFMVYCEDRNLDAVIEPFKSI